MAKVKDRLPHGQWLTWLRAEFSWSETTARQFMDSHALFKSAKLEDLPHLLELPPSAVADLAGSATPEAARKEVLEQVAKGKKPTTAQVRETVHRHKQPLSKPQKMRRQWDAMQKDKPAPVEGVEYKLVEDQWGFKHREPVGPTAHGPIMCVIREAEDLLVQMAAVAHAAENGDVDALRDVVEGGKQLTALMVRINELCAASTPEQANGADQSEQSTEPDIAVDPQPEQRISPRTGKPVRQYVRRSAD